MRVRSEQLNSLAQAAEIEYRDELCRFLRAELPDATAHFIGAELESFIEAADARAKRFGITSPIPFAQFVCLCLTSGLEFSSDPDVEAYLASPDQGQHQKVQALVDAVDDCEDEP